VPTDSVFNVFESRDGLDNDDVDSEPDEETQKQLEDLDEATQFCEDVGDMYEDALEYYLNFATSMDDMMGGMGMPGEEGGEYGDEDEEEEEEKPKKGKGKGKDKEVEGPAGDDAAKKEECKQ